jgi:oligoendopeptidase F
MNSPKSPHRRLPACALDARTRLSQAQAMTSTPLPRTWDLTPYFPSLESPEFTAAMRTLKADATDSLATFVNLPRTDAVAPEAFVSAWTDAFNRLESLEARASHLGSYLGCCGAADAASERVQREVGDLTVSGAQLEKLRSRLMAALRGIDAALLETLLASPGLSGAAHSVRRLAAEARYQMPADQEALASDLGVDGIRAWGQLYDTLAGKMMFEMVMPDGERRRVPMAQRVALTSNPDRAVRRAAFVGGNEVWSANADTCAAALNALAGTRHTLYGRRGRSDFLESPLHDASVSRPTLDALFAAIARRYEIPRRLLRLGARLQGTPALAWYDLNAPRPLRAPSRTWTWEEGVAAVQAAFDSAYPALGSYFRSMVDLRWIESEKRPNKRPGAFLTTSPVILQERIFMTFSGATKDVVTLAHEAGHAWHSHVLGDLRPCSQNYPMPLAETASTFAENLLVHGLLSAPGLTPDARAALLDMKTGDTPSYLLNIPARFLFESRFYRERRDGIVSPTRLCELMVETQREVYGDTLEAGAEDPWFWASKMHFFITDVAFYNFPYTFGFLLSKALFARFEREGASFLPHYEAFLRETGRATCEEAVKRTLGWDLTRTEFWDDAILACEPPIAAFESAAQEVVRAG